VIPCFEPVITVEVGVDVGSEGGQGGGDAVNDAEQIRVHNLAHNQRYPCLRSLHDCRLYDNIPHPPFHSSIRSPHSALMS
jgi:hypothetical protein